MLEGTGDFVVSPEAVVTVFIELGTGSNRDPLHPLQFKNRTTTKAHNGKPVADGQSASASLF